MKSCPRFGSRMPPFDQWRTDSSRSDPLSESRTRMASCDAKFQCVELSGSDCDLYEAPNPKSSRQRDLPMSFQRLEAETPQYGSASSRDTRGSDWPAVWRVAIRKTPSS